MPYIDYHLGTDIHLTKEDISNGLPRELTPKLNLGKDNRTWNKDQLKALTLILCNLVSKHNEDDGKFLYSRKKRTIPKQFNPNDVGYRSLFAVIDKLQEAKILDGLIAPPRTTGVNPKLLSEFTVTQQALDFAYALGINRQTVKVLDNFHVRVRNHKPPNEPLEFKQNPYTGYVEMLMSKYNHYLNQHSIMLKLDDETDEGILEYGTKLGGEKIHLYRNFKNWSEEQAEAEDVDIVIPFRNYGK